MPIRRIAALLVCVLAAATAYADRGLPLLRIVPQREHRSGAQVFAVTQDASGILHFGTLSGVASYDGAAWRHLELPNGSAVFTVAGGASPRVAVGGVGEFGVLEPDANGVERYRSLLPQLPLAQRDVGEVRGSCAVGNGFVFVSERYLIASDGTSARVIADLRSMPAPPVHCRRAGNQYFFDSRDGLHRLDTASMTLVPYGLEGRNVGAIVPYDGTRILAAVAGEGLLLTDGAVVTPFAPEASAWLRGKEIITGCRLHDGRMAIATRTNGVLVIAADGAIDSIVDSAAGLPPDAVTDALADREGSLWVTLHGPIAQVDVASPVSLFDSRKGLGGSVQSAMRIGERLYFTTSHGLHVLAPGDATARMVAGIAQAWETTVVGNELIVGSHDGVYVVDGEHARRVAGTEGLVTLSVARSEGDPARVWIGARKGIGSMRRIGSEWRFDGLIAGTPGYPTSLVEHDGALWVGTVFSGIARIAGTEISSYASGEIFVTRIGRRLVALRDGAIFEVQRDGRLLPDPHFSRFGEPGVFHAVEDARGNVWLNSKPPRMIARLAGGTYATVARPLVSVTPDDIQQIDIHADGTVWFCSNQGAYRYDPAADRPSLAPTAPLIRRVSRQAFGRLRVEYAPASFRSGITYQYRLDPADAWSEWTSETFIDYTNLDAGDYTFRVRARDAVGRVTPEAAWKFSVAPPWYRSPVAYVLWTLLGAIAIAAIVALRTRTLHRHAERLRILVSERTEELQEANERLERLSMLDELTGIANRRFFQRVLHDDWKSAETLHQPVALILIDLDRFKQLNDERGHPAGDAVLSQVGRFLSRRIRRSGELGSRSGDIVARIGGEEFAILLANTGEDEAGRIGEGLRTGLEELPIVFGDATLHITASAGVAAVVPGSGVTSDQLIQSADRALYAAKAAGRNCVRVAGDEREDASAAVSS